MVLLESPHEIVIPFFFHSEHGHFSSLNTIKTVCAKHLLWLLWVCTWFSLGLSVGTFFQRRGDINLSNLLAKVNLNSVIAMTR